MTTIPVDRELLERVADHLEWDGSEPMTTIQYAYKCDGLAAELRALLASPQDSAGAVGEMRLSTLVEGLVIPVVEQDLPVGTKLYTTPQPAGQAVEGELEALSHPIATCKRGLFETWAMETKHPVFSFIGSDWLDHGDDPNTYANDYIQGAWVMWQHLSAAAPKPAQQPQGEFGDAYQGAREDLAIWKRRALEAEKALRHKDQIIDGLVLDAHGESHMGGPAIDAEVLVERKAMERLFRACGLSGSVPNTQIANLAANKLEAKQPNPDVARLRESLAWLRAVMANHDKTPEEANALADADAALAQTSGGEMK